MIKSEVQEVERNKVALLIEVGKEKVQEAYSAFFRRAAQSVNIPGFRKGKIPKNILVNHIGKESVREEVERSLVSEVYPQVVREKKIHPLSDVDIQDSNLEEGKPFTFKAVVEVLPKLPEFSYSGRHFDAKQVLVDEESIQKVLAKLSEKFAKTKTVEDGTLEFGDYCLVDVEVKCDGIIDSELSAEKAYRKFSEDDDVFVSIRGMKSGETRSFSYDVKKDSEKNSKYFGKKLDYTVTLQKISRAIVPTMDDAFAKDVGDFKTLAELKEKIRSDLEKQSKSDAENQAIDHLLMEIAKETNLEVPEIMVQNTIDYLMERIDHRWRQYNSSLKEFLERTNKDEKEFREGFREKAVWETQRLLLIEAIAERLSITASEAEYRAEVERLASESGQPIETLLEKFSRDNSTENIKKNLIHHKVNEFLLMNNEIHFDKVKENDFNKGDTQGDSCSHSH